MAAPRSSPVSPCEDRAPSAAPKIGELKPASNLTSVFEDCHNHIYANEGMLKEKIFHEIVKLLLMKLSDERRPPGLTARFSITSAEQREALEGRGHGFAGRMNRLFSAIKREHPRLFGDEAGLALRPLTIAHVVGRLQSISLSRTPGDIKGEAFQAFVNRHQRGDRGEFFTPHPIVRLAVEMADPRPDELVGDPACGSGGFLIQAIAHVFRDGRSGDREKSGYIRNRIRGIEFNPDIAQAAAVRLAFEGGTGEEVLCANSLGKLPSLFGAFDVILTNPPFGSKGRIADPSILEPYELARKWERSPAGWSRTGILLEGQAPDVLFLERCLAFLKPGGRLAIVLPDGLLQNPSSGGMRTWLKERARILGVVSVPQEAFVPYGTAIKTSLLFAQKLPSLGRTGCFMARLRRIGYDVKGRVLHRKDRRGRVVRNAAGMPVVDEDIGLVAGRHARFRAGRPFSEDDDRFTLPTGNLDSRLDVEHYLPGDRRMIRKLAGAGAKRLGDLAEIVQDGDDFRLTGDEEIRYIAISNIDCRTLQVASQQAMRAHEAPSRARYRVREGDILTAVSGASTGTPRQATALVTAEESGAICSNGLAVLRNIRGVDPLFLLCFLRTGYFLRQVRRLMTGHAIPALSLDDLAGILVPLPSLGRQRRVARSVRRLLEIRREARAAGEGLVGEVEALLADSDHRASR